MKTPQFSADTPKIQVTKDLVCAAWQSQGARDERALSRHGQDHVVRGVLCERAAGIPVQDDDFINRQVDATSVEGGIDQRPVDQPPILT